MGSAESTTANPAILTGSSRQSLQRQYPVSEILLNFFSFVYFIA